jgi:manganese transport protein
VTRRPRLPRTIALLGPAFVAAVAYIDPGNIATNFQAGSRYGYLLVWTVVAADVVAMLIQYLSAKLGLASGQSLPALVRSTYPRSRHVLWAQAEVVAMATDLAEFVGAAVGLRLLFGLPLFTAGWVTAVVSFAVLGLQRRGYRPFEVAIAALLFLVALGFIADVVVVGHQSGRGFAGGLQPRLAGSDSLELAVGIIGATVMPHAIYIHSALTKHRVTATDESGRHRLLSAIRLDVGLGLGAAGLINVAMLATAAGLLHTTGHTGAVDTLTSAHRELRRVAGGSAALAFAVALLASGVSSSSVGTFAGQVVMQGFIRRRIPVTVRRAITMTPALIILGLGLPVTRTLVDSQVVLSFGIPFALVPLILLTRRRDVMGELTNRRTTTAAASLAAVVIIALNVYLLIDVLG